MGIYSTKYTFESNLKSMSQKYILMGIVPINFPFSEKQMCFISSFDNNGSLNQYQQVFYCFKSYLKRL